MLGIVLLHMSLKEIGGRSRVVAESMISPGVLADSPILPGEAQKTCSGLWNISGSYCDLKKLVAFNDGEINTVAYMNAEFSSLVSSTRSLLDLVMDRLRCSTTSSEYHTILSFNKTFGDIDLVGARKDSQKCFEHLAKIRNSSLCSLCTLNNTRYLVGNLVAIDNPTCTTFVDECYPHLHRLSSIWKFMSMDFVLRLQMRSSHQLEAYKLLQSKYGINGSILRSTDVLLTMVKEPSLDNLKSASISEICGRFISLRSSPIVGSLTKLLRAQSLLLSELIRGTSRSAWRHLELSDIMPITDVFRVFADVSVIEFDSAASSVSGLTPSSVPMNLTLAFP